MLGWALDIYALALLVDPLPRRIGRLLKGATYAAAYGLSLTETFLFLRFNLLLSPTVLTLLSETSAEESGEFLSGMVRSNAFWETVAIYAPILAVHVLIASGGMRRIRHALRKKAETTATAGGETARKRVLAERGFAADFTAMAHRACSLAAAVLIAAALPHWWPQKQAVWRYLSNTQSRYAEGVAESHFFAPHYRVLHAAHLVRMSRGEVERLKLQMDTATVDSVAGTCPNIVVVIGESYNKHHASLYGYPRPTTPRLDRLKRKGELTVFDDVVTPWNLTSNAFKSFLSTHSADAPGSWADGVLFPLLFRRAGYKVAFVTNQFYKSAAQGSIDFNGSFFLNEPHLDSLCFDYRNAFRSRDDRGITRLLGNYVPGRRNLYLLHLWGQHMEYERRYPEDRAFFRPEDYDRPELTPTQRAIVAHYDNATRYNDTVLADIIRYFRRQDVILVYFADHGEEVYDDGVRCYGRVHSDAPPVEVIRHEYEVPFAVWASPLFRKRHPDIARRLRAARHRPFSHDDLPHLLLGLAGIGTAHYDASRDPLSAHFKARARWLRGGKIDYDRALRTTETK